MGLDDADQERFDRLRSVELKHGRISMLAVLGHIVTSAGVRLPGNIDLEGTTFESIPSGIAALSKVPPLGLAQLFIFVGALELGVMKDVTGEAEFVGDFRNGAIDYGWDTFDEETKLQKRHRAQPGPCRHDGYPCPYGPRTTWKCWNLLPKRVSVFSGIVSPKLVRRKRLQMLGICYD